MIPKIPCGKKKRELKVQMKDQELAQQEVVRNLKKVSFVISYLIFELKFFLRQTNHTHQNYAKIFSVKLVKSKRNMRKNYAIYVKKWNYVVKTEIHEIEERKNQQINDLLRNHEKAFSDIKKLL